MSERENDKPLNDEMLVAYIDGELSDTERAEVEAVINGDRRAAARLDHLARSRLPFREAFEPLLSAAPTEKLDRMLSSDFSLDVDIPASDPRAHAGSMPRDSEPDVVTLETDQVFQPADRDRRSADRRHLGLRILKCELRPAP